MVAPGFLANPQVRRWLNGVEPAWTMLEFESFNALHDEPSINNDAIRLEPNLTATEVSASAVSVNTMLLLRRSAEAGGLKLTATGNLSRVVVEGMLGIEWPDYDKAELVQYNKVINEPTSYPCISFACYCKRRTSSESLVGPWYRPRWVGESSKGNSRTFTGSSLPRRLLASQPWLFRPIPN
jgi:hypothetical protein